MISDHICMGTGPVFFSDRSDSKKSHNSDDQNSKITLEFNVSELVRFQFSSATKKFVLETDKTALEKQLLSQGYKCSRAAPDEIIKQRNASELRGLFNGRESLSKISGAAKGILSQIKAEQGIDDEESMVSVTRTPHSSFS